MHKQELLVFDYFVQSETFSEQCSATIITDEMCYIINSLKVNFMIS